MAIGAFPAAKLGVLAIKQISKPIANVIKSNAKQSPIFRKYVCMPPAQLYNWVEVKTKMWALNLGKPVAVPPLNEAMAIELGANLLGEAIIFVIGAAVLIFEYTRQSNNEAKKQETIRQEKAELAITLAEMGFRLERQDAQIREMTRALADLGKFVNPNLCSLMMLCCVIKLCLESLHNFCLPFIRMLFRYYCLLNQTP
uniref:Putative OPA3-like protein CG13603 n=1 Tax=Bactrocera latifrons TaxID=174628 RepID=A0A0K8W532_BACLA